MERLLFVLLVCAASISLAQSVEVGPVMSARLSQPVFDNSEVRLTNRGRLSMGVSGGISATMKASELFGLTTEVLYHYQRKLVKGTDDYSYFREQLHYIKLPVLFQYSRPIKHYRSYAVIGPVVNYWIGGKGNVQVPEMVEGDYDGGVDYTMEFDGTSSLERFYVSDPNRWQLGIQVGGGVAIPVQKNFLKVDARFEWGHTNLAKKHSSYSPFIFYDITLDHTFHSISLSCSYVFSFDLFELTRKGKSSQDKKRK